MSEEQPLSVTFSILSLGLVAAFTAIMMMVGLSILIESALSNLGFFDFVMGNLEFVFITVFVVIPIIRLIIFFLNQGGKS